MNVKRGQLIERMFYCIYPSYVNAFLNYTNDFAGFFLPNVKKITSSGYFKNIPNGIFLKYDKFNKI